MCLGEEQRYEYDCYLYEDGGTKECVSAKECETTKKGGAYLELLICSSILPSDNGKFA